MACGCQGSQAVSPSERAAERAARREERLAVRAAKRTESSTTASTRYWNGPQGKRAT